MTKPKFKTFASTKALLQAILDRRNTDATNDEIRLATNLLKILFDNKPLYVVADANRFASDFARTLQLEYLHIQKPVEINLIKPGDNVVILYMGPRTAKQKQFYENALIELHKIENLEIYRISRW